ncbi:MAG: glycosyltransferase family 61 protein [Alphaproteobacteria bacterium]|nr:glycosyltransferase family 61 protein [Alphaproteobacteria bacterium]
MKLKSLEVVSLYDWCRPTDVAGLLDGGSANVVWRAKRGGSVTLPPPDIIDDPAEVAGIGDDCHDVALNVVKNVLRYEDRSVARLSDVVVRGGCRTVMLDEHLAIGESYHDKRAFEFIKAGPASHYAMVAPINVNGEQMPLEVKFYAAFEPDQIIDEPAVLVDSRWSETYFHWILETLPRLWYRDALPELADVPVIVPGQPTRFQRETLDALGVTRTIPFTGQAIRAKRLYFPTFMAPTSFSTEMMDWIKESLCRVFGLDPDAKPSRLIYASRRKARARHILNEAEIAPMLAARGFEVMCLEDLSLRDQVALFSQAKVVVAPNGSGTANFVFAPRGAALIDLVTLPNPHPIFWMMAKLKSCRYGRLPCQTTQDGRADMVVDAKRLTAMLDQVM